MFGSYFTFSEQMSNVFGLKPYNIQKNIKKFKTIIDKSDL